jgi:hypothetical protein
MFQRGICKQLPHAKQERESENVIGTSTKTIGVLSDIWCLESVTPDEEFDKVNLLGIATRECSDHRLGKKPGNPVKIAITSDYALALKTVPWVPAIIVSHHAMSRLSSRIGLFILMSADPAAGNSRLTPCRVIGAMWNLRLCASRSCPFPVFYCDSTGRGK